MVAVKRERVAESEKLPRLDLDSFDHQPRILRIAWIPQRLAQGILRNAHFVNGEPFVYKEMLENHQINFRLNTKLEANGYPPMSSLVKDLSDGVRLIQLMVCSYTHECRLLAHQHT